MRDLVSLEYACQQLRIDYEVDSDGNITGALIPWLREAIPDISEAVALWIKDWWRLYEPERGSDGNPIIDSDGAYIPAVDSDGEFVVRRVVRRAVVIELASQDRFREGEGKDNVMPADAGHGYVLNKASTALLTPLRRPTVS